MRSFSICNKYYYCNQVKKEEMGRMCSMYGEKIKSWRIVEIKYKVGEKAKDF
jgi:hypothetical protein